MNTKQIEGKSGEMEATKYLKKNGYEIICNNFRCQQGEIDIIAKDKNEIVFIEVKTRSSKNYGEPREAVDKNKKKHIMDTAKYYLYKEHKENSYVRIDVIEVYIKKDKIILNHIKQAI